MFRNDNGNFVKTLSNKVYKSNKNRNIIAIIAITLTSIMFTSLFTIGFSMLKATEQFSMRQVGTSSHVGFKLLTDEQTEKIISHNLVEEYGYGIILGVSTDPKLSGHQTEIRYADKNFAEYSFKTPTTGKLPEKYNEICLDTTALNKLSIPHEIGQKVSLTWQEDNKGQFIKSDDFILSGFSEGDKVSSASFALVSKEYVDKNYSHLDQEKELSKGNIAGLAMLNIMLKNANDIEKSAIQIVNDSGYPDIDYGVNWAYVSSSLTPENIGQIVIGICGILLILISGYLIIFNIFNISISKDIKMFGMLKTLGTTEKQINSIINKQTFTLCLFGIPIGLILGYIIGFVMLPFVIPASSGGSVMSTNPLIFIGAALFSFVTVFLSSRLPAKEASKVSPMEAFRYNDTIISGKRKNKSSRNGAKITNMALNNLGRNKKRTIVVILSLSLGLILLNSIYTISNSFDLEKYINSVAITDYTFADYTLRENMSDYNQNNKTISHELLDDIKKVSDVDNLGVAYFYNENYNISEKSKNAIISYFNKDSRLEMASTIYRWLEAFDKMKDENIVESEIYGIDSWIMEKGIILKGNFDKEEFEKGNHVIQLSTADNGAEYYTNDIGDKILINGKEFILMAYIDFGSAFSGGIGNKLDSLGNDFILNITDFKNLYGETPIMQGFIDLKNDKSIELETVLGNYIETEPNLAFTNSDSMLETYKSQTNAQIVMQLTICIIIAIIGIINFCNTIITSIMSRKNEFAILQSIGMTDKQLSTMLSLEGLNYALITIISTLAISSIASLVILKPSIDISFVSTYSFTLLPILICSPILIIISLTVPYICLKDIQKESIIARLRFA